MSVSSSFDFIMYPPRSSLPAIYTWMAIWSRRPGPWSILPKDVAKLIGHCISLGYRYHLGSKLFNDDKSQWITYVMVQSFETRVHGFRTTGFHTIWELSRMQDTRIQTHPYGYPPCPECNRPMMPKRIGFPHRQLHICSGCGLKGEF